MQNAPDNIYLLVLLGMIGTFLLCVVIIAFYIRYQKRLYKQQQSMNAATLAHQVQLLHSTIQSQENERKRIGSDLHDDVGGYLANLRMQIGKIVKESPSGTLQQMAANCQQLTDVAISTVRNIAHNLSPSGLELFGFSEVLGDLCERTALSSGLEIRLSNNPCEALDTLDMHVSLALYRVIQELLTNTIKHAQATEITLAIVNTADILTISYADNGVGIDVDLRKKGMGMYNIESRLSMIHAVLTLETGTVNGFAACIRVPVSTLQNIHSHE